MRIVSDIFCKNKNEMEYLKVEVVEKEKSMKNKFCCYEKIGSLIKVDILQRSLENSM